MQRIASSRGLSRRSRLFERESARHDAPPPLAREPFSRTRLRRASRIGARAAGLLGALGALGCQDVDRFALDEGETYCGSLVSAPVFHEGILPEGVPPALRLRLDLDVDHLTTRPGPLTTDDISRGLCSQEGKPLFDRAELRTISEVLHDPISTATFGSGNDQNFFAYVDSSCAATMLAIISLMADTGIEVRLFKPAPAPADDTPAGERPGFALFKLRRQAAENCDF